MCCAFIKFYLTLKTHDLVNLIITIGLFKDVFESKVYLYIFSY